MRPLPYSFSLSEDAISHFGGLDPLQALDRVSSIRNLWKRAGLLVVDGRGELQRAYERQWQARSFPQGTRKKLKDLFFEMRGRIARDLEWQLVEGDAGRRPSGGTLFVHPAAAEEWGLTQGLPTCVVPEDVEICRADCLNMSRWTDLEEAFVLQKKAPSREVVERLAALKAIARVAIVIDPYCAKEQVVNEGGSGLLKFLELLAAAPSTLERRFDSVVVYSGKDVARSQKDGSLVTGQEIHQAWKAARTRFRAAGIRSVGLRLVEGRRLGDIAHDRFISFRDLQLGRWGGITIQIGGGFSVFEGKALKKGTTVAIVSNESFHEMVRSLDAEPSLESWDLEGEEMEAGG